VDFALYQGEAPPSNLPLAGLGTALLWMGWFGFNGGSAVHAGNLAVSAVVR
jgi:Amt family ammonium transporter